MGQMQGVPYVRAHRGGGGGLLPIGREEEGGGSLNLLAPVPGGGRVYCIYTLHYGSLIPVTVRHDAAATYRVCCPWASTQNSQNHNAKDCP